MDVSDFNTFVLIPSLKIVNLYSDSAKILLLGTAIIESELKYFGDRHSDTAFGIYQIEASTYKNNQQYLNKATSKFLKNACLAACYYDVYPSVDSLIYNLRWATIMARIKYWVQREPLPDYGDAEGLASYYKKYYNSHTKSNENEIVILFESLITSKL